MTSSRPNYATREEYLAAWDEANTEIEAVKAHAWVSMRRGGCVPRRRARAMGAATAGGLALRSRAGTENL